MMLENLLTTAFTRDELAYLRGELHFATALEHLYTANDFEHLCRIGFRLLAARARRNGVAVGGRRQRLPKNSHPVYPNLERSMRQRP